MDVPGFITCNSSKHGDGVTSSTDLELQVSKKLEEMSKSGMNKKTQCLQNYDDFIDVIGEDTRAADAGDAHHSYLPAVEQSPSSGSDYSINSRSSLETSSNSSTGSQNGNRTNYSPEQVQKLSDAFDRNKYPDVEEREKIAAIVGVPEKKVKIWFQNKRARAKPRANADLRIHSSVIPSLYIPQAPPVMFQTLPQPYGPVPTLPMPASTGSYLPYPGLPHLTSTASSRSPVDTYGSFLLQQPHIPSFHQPLPYHRPEAASSYMYPYMYSPYC